MGKRKDDGLRTALRYYFAVNDPETGEEHGRLVSPFGVEHFTQHDLRDYDDDAGIRKTVDDWVDGKKRGHIRTNVDRKGEWAEYGDDPTHKTSRYTDVVLGDKAPSGIAERESVMAENPGMDLEGLSGLRPDLFGFNEDFDRIRRKEMRHDDRTNYDVGVIKGHKGVHRGASVIGLDDPEYARYTWDELGLRGAGERLFGTALRRAAGMLGRPDGYGDFDDDKPNVILQGDAADRYRKWMKGRKGDKGKSRYGELSSAADAILEMLMGGDWNVPMTGAPARLQLYSVKLRPEDMYTSKDMAEQKVTDWRDMPEEMTVKRLMPSQRLDSGLVEDWLKGYLTPQRPDFDEFRRLFGAQFRPMDPDRQWTTRKRFVTRQGVPMHDVDARYEWLFRRMFDEDPGQVISDSTMKDIRKCLSEERTRRNVAGALSGLRY